MCASMPDDKEVKDFYDLTKHHSQRMDVVDKTVFGIIMVLGFTAMFVMPFLR